MKYIQEKIFLFLIFIEFELFEYNINKKNIYFTI